MVPQGTHTAPLEHRDLVELRVERFLREHLPASPPAPLSAYRESEPALRDMAASSP